MLSTVFDHITETVSSIVGGKNGSGKHRNVRKNKGFGSSSITQGQFFNNNRAACDTIGNVEGFDGGVGDSSVASKISPSMYSVLSHYGNFVKLSDDTIESGSENEKYKNKTFYVNRFGILRQLDGTQDTLDSETCGGRTTSNIKKGDFEMLKKNGRKNLDDGNIMSPDALCGYDGMFLKQTNTDVETLGWVNPITGKYKQFDFTDASASKKCKIPANDGAGMKMIAGSKFDETVAAIGFDATDTKLTTTDLCKLPNHVGKKSIADWDSFIDSEKKNSSQVVQLLNEFNTAKASYDAFMDEHKGNIPVPSFDPELAQYYGKSVYIDETPTSGNTYDIDISNYKRYFITKFGIIREWLPAESGGKWWAGVWLKADKTTCKYNNMNHVVRMPQQEFDRIKINIGQPMNSYEPCNVSGRVVRKGNTDIYAWVDVMNLKHELSGGVAESCAGGMGTAIQLSDQAYDAIQSGDGYGPSDGCTVTGLNPSLFTEFISLNSELIRLGNEVLVMTEQMNESTIENQEELNELIADTQDGVGQLAEEQRTVDMNQSNLIHAQGDIFYADKQMAYNFRLYLVWIIIAVLVSTIAVHSFISGQNTMVAYGLLIFLILLFMYYVLVRLIRG